MSEAIVSERRIRLLDYCMSLSYSLSSDERRVLWDRHEADLKSVTPADVLWLVNQIMIEIPDILKVKQVVSRMINAFSHALLEYNENRHFDNPYVDLVILRNRTVDTILDSLRGILKQANISEKEKQRGFLDTAHRGALLEGFENLSGYLAYYTFKELVLFPSIEKYITEHRCTGLMWSIHDDIRKNLKEMRKVLQETEPSLAEINKISGRIFFDVKGMMFREEYILLPAVIDRIPRSVWAEIAAEQTGENGGRSPGELRLDRNGNLEIDLLTGNPTASQLISIFSHLPVDITLIDAQDRVVFYSNPPDRIFPRTKAIIGRKVQQCHPPESVSIVEKILESFRSKRQERAEFRIQLGSRYIKIEYKALYDEAGEYAGTLEISQDIGSLQKLSGEKRLLDWES